MARPRHIPCSEYPYHIAARSSNRERYPISLDEIWKIYCNFLWLTHLKYELHIHAFVLMPNHFHMLAATPNANLSEAMNYFISQSSKEINRAAYRINQIQGTRFFRSLIKSSHYYSHAYKYVYRNPVKAGLSNKVENYRYSTLQMFCGLQSFDLPLEPDRELMSDIDSTLKWLNKRPTDSHWLEIKRALKHSEFKLKAHRHSREKSHLHTIRI